MRSRTPPARRAAVSGFLVRGVAAFGACLLGAAVLGSTGPVAVPAYAAASPSLERPFQQDVGEPAAPPRPAVLSARVIGHSVNGHAIRAFELGDRSAHVTVVALAAMHGNETGGLVVLHRLRDGRPVHGVHLWVIPRDNPDGVLRDNRHNARSVDLNRNFATKWKFQTGYYYSGPRPWSEPETRSLRRFLNHVDPDFVVTFHSPLHGIDAYESKDRPFAHRLARNLNLPLKSFDCSGGCHGTLTQWFNTRHRGACVTVEFGASPSKRYLDVRAPRGLLRAIGGYR